jgi:hypothetical protein
MAGCLLLKLGIAAPVPKNVMFIGSGMASLFDFFRYKYYYAAQ